MHFDHLLDKKLVLIILLASSTFSQDAEELLELVQEKINAVEQLQGDCQARVNSANQRIKAAEDQEAADAANAFETIDSLSSQINRIGASTLGRVSALENLVTELETFLAEMIQRATRLENINAIWKANFKVVNSTFTVLRNRKVKFIIPVIFLSSTCDSSPTINIKRKKKKGSVG